MLARAVVSHSPQSHRDWPAILAGIGHAFQAIAAPISGRVFGYEALMRGHRAFGFATPVDLLDAAHADGRLVEVELALRRKAATHFYSHADHRGLRLFLNLDSRIFTAPDYHGGLLSDCLSDLDISPSLICLEISERAEIAVTQTVDAIFQQYRDLGYLVALDDFGVGYAGLKLLYEARPDLLKIDRFFIAGIDRDPRKRALVGQIVTHAQSRGLQVVAEGIETDAEFYVCRDLGCDFVQGFRIAEPSSIARALPLTLREIDTLNATDRRQARRPSPSNRLREAIRAVPPLDVGDNREAMLDRFRRDDRLEVIPVLDATRRPLGVIRQRDLRQFVFSRFGGELLRNRSIGNGLRDFVQPVPVCDIATPVDRLVAVFSSDAGDGAGRDGVLVTEEGEYRGFLDAAALVRLVHEASLIDARDQNPLTHLPGNRQVDAVIEAARTATDRAYTLAYFDFDHFKPFNDRFGFRQGDRALQMFAALLRRVVQELGGFAGHIGGDDFFAGFPGRLPDSVAEPLAGMIRRFRSDVESLYDPDSRTQGFLTARDRDGQMRRFPLLGVSLVLLGLPVGATRPSVEDIAITLAAAKKQAKLSPSGLDIRLLG